MEYRSILISGSGEWDHPKKGGGDGRSLFDVEEKS